MIREVPKLKSKTEAYRWFIDMLADAADVHELERQLSMHGHLERLNESDLPLEPQEQQKKAFLLSLDAQQRETLLAILAEKMAGVAHDFAARFEEGVSLGEIQISVNGFELGESPYTTYHYDTTCRMHGDPWPDGG